MHIAFFGLGNMGFPIAANLLKHRHAVTTAIHRDPTPALRLQELGAAVASSPAEALKDAEIIFTIVPNDSALLGLLNESFLAALPTGSVVVDMTSASADAAKQAAALCASRGAALLDAPVSGGVKGAASGTMSMMCAGDRAVFDRVSPVLVEITGKLCYVGSQPGQAKIIKSLNNLLSAINKTAVGEAWRIADAHGVDPDAFFDAISSSSGDSFALRAAFPKIRAEDYAPGFTVALMRKDLELAMGLADDMVLPLGEAVLDYYRRAREFDQEDSTAVAKVRYPSRG